MSKMVQVITTIDNLDTAGKISESLVNQKLAACAQILGPIESIYFWENKMEKTREWQCVFKTRKKLYPEVQKVILDLHPYKIPEIIMLPILKGSKDYIKWIKTETKS